MSSSNWWRTTVLWLRLCLESRKTTMYILYEVIERPVCPNIYRKHSIGSNLNWTYALVTMFDWSLIATLRKRDGIADRSPEWQLFSFPSLERLPCRSPPSNGNIFQENTTSSSPYCAKTALVSVYVLKYMTSGGCAKLHVYYNIVQNLERLSSNMQ